MSDNNIINFPDKKYDDHCSEEFFYDQLMEATKAIIEEEEKAYKKILRSEFLTGMHLGIVFCTVILAGFWVFV